MRFEPSGRPILSSGFKFLAAEFICMAVRSSCSQRLRRPPPRSSAAEESGGWRIKIEHKHPPASISFAMPRLSLESLLYPSRACLGKVDRFFSVREHTRGVFQMIVFVLKRSQLMLNRSHLVSIIMPRQGKRGASSINTYELLISTLPAPPPLPPPPIVFSAAA